MTAYDSSSVTRSVYVLETVISYEEARVNGVYWTLEDAQAAAGGEWGQVVGEVPKEWTRGADPDDKLAHMYGPNTITEWPVL